MRVGMGTMDVIAVMLTGQVPSAADLKAAYPLRTASERIAYCAAHCTGSEHVPHGDGCPYSDFQLGRRILDAHLERVRRGVRPLCHPACEAAGYQLRWAHEGYAGITKTR